MKNVMGGVEDTGGWCREGAEAGALVGCKWAAGATGPYS